MQRDDDSAAASRRSSADSAARIEDVAAPPEQQSQHSQSQSQAHAAPEEQKKQKKHGRVHKREKELYGLVTPVFLPLLDARESMSPEKKDSKSSAEQSPAAGDAEGSKEGRKEGRKTPKETRATASDMTNETPVKERSASDPVVKSRRPSIKKKSALRHSSTPRNRKRVSLVIDDQVVLPSDMIQEPALISPSSETTSATTSTASLDEMIDPRLTSDAPVYIEHHDAVHHSLPPLGVHQPKTSPVKASAPPFSNPTPVVTEAAHSPPTSPGIRSPTIAYAPPSYATRSFLDPPPERMHIEDIPVTAGPEPIYPDENDPEDQLATLATEAAEEDFQTYVGGISGSGVDDVNQVGSIGYPSSLGASYLESYMQSRPLSVRMAAAEREGDEAEVRRLRSIEQKRKEREAKESREKEQIDEEDWDLDVGKVKDVDDDDDFMGSMDDF
jgi:hypothetical protein